MADRRFTDLELERSLAGDLPPARADVLAREGTPADRARLAELEAEHAAFLGSVDVDQEVQRIEQRVARQQPERRNWFRWLAPIGAIGAIGALAVAAVVLVVIRHPAPASLPDDDDLRAKGAAVSLVIHTADQQLATGDTVSAGTKIRFEAQGATPGYIAIIGIDGARATTVYYPYGAHAAAAIGRENRLLPSAIELDATPGDETFYALFSTTPFELEPLLPAIAGNHLPAGLAVSRVVLRKK